MGTSFITVQHALNAGEVSARTEARQDQNKYQAALRRCLNWQPVTVGGMVRRPGLKFIQRAKMNGAIVRGFRFGNEQFYILEMGPGYIRFYRDGELILSGAPGLDPDDQSPELMSLIDLSLPFGGLLPQPGSGAFNVNEMTHLAYLAAGTFIQEVATPYDLAHLREVFQHQSADVQYHTHRFYRVHKLSRVNANPDVFTFAAVNFDPPATIEDEPTGAALGAGTLTPAATTGVGVVFTAENPVWFAGGTSSDITRLIISGGGRAVITVVLSSTQVQADILDAFASTDPIPAANWRLRGAPNARLDITNNRKEPGQIATVTSHELGGAGSLAAFRASDAGKYLLLFGGLVRIEQVTSDSAVVVAIKTQLRDIEENNPDPTPAWTLEVPDWSDERGHPSCGCFFQERHWLAKDFTINGSATNDFERFAKGGGEDDAIRRVISDDEVNPIVWIKGLKALQIGTPSRCYEAGPTSQSGALTQSSFKVEPTTRRGSARINPVLIGGVILYVQAGQRKIRELIYDFATDKHQNPNLFQLAEHLVDGHYVTEIAFAQEPDSVVYAVRDDGALLALTYQEDENVIGWSVFQTSGRITSVAVIPRPGTGKDWVWVTVEREIDGETATYIEAFEPDEAEPGREWHELQTDSAVMRVPGENGVVSQLSHLEGETVRVIGDGMLFDDAVVEEGRIQLSPNIPVSRVEVGLDYVSDAITLRPIVPLELGGPLIAKGWVKLGLFVRRALGLQFGQAGQPGEQLVWRKPYHPMDGQVPLQEGYRCINELGYDPFCRVRVQQALPFPAEVLNVVGKLQVGDEWDCDSVDENSAFAVLDLGVVPPRGSAPAPATPGALGISPAQVVFQCCPDTDNQVEFHIEGGVAPFTWSTTRGALTVAPDGRSATLRASPVPMAMATQNAYRMVTKFCDVFTACLQTTVRCDGQSSQVCSGANIGTCWTDAGGEDSCSGTSFGDELFRLGSACPSLPLMPSACVGLYAFNLVCDLRSPEMVAAGCVPCNFEFQSGAVVTAQDAAGQFVSAIVAGSKTTECTAP